jgi:hypothetical protein
MNNIIKNEKIILISIFTLLFILSSLLIYIMIEKDLRVEETGKRWINQPSVNEKPENSWPKVEIQTSK